MILFFYGSDTYRLSQKVRQLKAKFIDSSLGDTNLIVLDGKNIDYNEFVRQTLALPFLSKKRLVIIENLLISGKKELQEKITDFLPKVPDSTVLTFVESGKPDRRTSLFKKLNQPKISQEFELLDGPFLHRYLKKEIENRGGSIDSIALNKFIEYVGNDLWRASNEIDKLTNYNEQLTTESIELLVQPQVQSNIFQLIEKTSAKNTKGAVNELYKLFDKGEAEIYILTMIVYQYRNLLVLKDLKEVGIANRFELAKKSGLNPFVLGKVLNIVDRYSLIELKNIYKKLRDYDWKIKIGKIEPRVALELLVFELGR